MFKKTNQKIAEFFRYWWNHRQNPDDISPKKAHQIQKQSYLTSSLQIEKSCTPPYILIALQLKSPEEQVFKAAVYYLHAIAVNQPKYRQIIINIMEEYIKNNPQHTARAEYLRQKSGNLRDIDVK